MRLQVFLCFFFQTVASELVYITLLAALIHSKRTTLVIKWTVKQKKKN